jgi:hypothetical protein
MTVARHIILDRKWSGSRQPLKKSELAAKSAVR